MSECDLCRWEDDGIGWVNTNVLEKLDVTVCDAHLQMLRELGDE